MLQRVKLLLQSTGWQEVCNLRDPEGCAFLHHCRDLDVLKLLLGPIHSQVYNFDAMLNAHDDNGRTPLYFTSSGGDGSKENFIPQCGFLLSIVFDAELILLKEIDLEGIS